MPALGIKLVAVFCMVVDHSAVVFSGRLTPASYFVLRCIGRLAFPLFVFLAADGCRRTKNRPRYLVRLLVFGAVSQLVYRPALHLEGLNVLFTLAAGVAAVMLAEWVRAGGAGRAPLGFLGAAALLACTPVLDYGWQGVLLLPLLYYASSRTYTAWSAAAILLLVYWPGQGREYWWYLLAAVASIPLMLAYNGRRGYGGKAAQYGFYLFYPLHLLVLACLGG